MVLCVTMYIINFGEIELMNQYADVSEEKFYVNDIFGGANALQINFDLYIEICTVE